MGVCLFVQTCISLGKTLIKIWNANDSSNGVQILRNLMIYEKQMNNKVYYNACRDSIAVYNLLQINQFVSVFPYLRYLRPINSVLNKCCIACNCFLGKD